MRIVIAGPPKTGNVWLKCLLGAIYGLQTLGPRRSPPEPKLEAFRAWAAAGGFKDGAIFHQHYDYSPELVDAIAAVPAHAVTIVRDPYDAFVSSYFTLQQHIGDETRTTGRSRDALMGKPLDDPAVFGYLRRDGFKRHLVKATAWLESGRSIVSRYEALHADPLAELTRITDQMVPVETSAIERAIASCSAENLRKLGGRQAKHVRAAKVGDSRERLNDEHLAIFREQYADLIRGLGYEVR